MKKAISILFLLFAIVSLPTRAEDVVPINVQTESADILSDTDSTIYDIGVSAAAAVVEAPAVAKKKIDTTSALALLGCVLSLLAIILASVMCSSLQKRCKNLEDKLVRIESLSYKSDSLEKRINILERDLKTTREKVETLENKDAVIEAAPNEDDGRVEESTVKEEPAPSNATEEPSPVVPAPEACGDPVEYFMYPVGNEVKKTSTEKGERYYKMRIKGENTAEFEFCGNLDKALANEDAIFGNAAETETHTVNPSHFETIEAGLMEKSSTGWTITRKTKIKIF